MIDDDTIAEECLAQARRALRMVCVSLPHLAGLSGLVRIRIDLRVPSAGIFRSGLMVLNPDWFAPLSLQDATFVVAHEVLHLALRTHDRAPLRNAREFNCAHDYIINDLLRNELGLWEIPAGGLDMPGARHRAVEELFLDLLASKSPDQNYAWNPATPREQIETSDDGNKTLGAALRAAGVVNDGASGASAPPTPGSLDALPDALEKEWFGDDAATPEQVAGVAAALQQSLEIKAAIEFGKEFAGQLQGNEPGGHSVYVDALRTTLRPAWEGALQRWMEGATPGPRTYTRPSRRGADRTDLVLPGRRREGWTLHIVLDTSGSMGGTHERILGMLASFCDGVMVDRVHLLQCDTCVATDEWLTPEELHRYRIMGGGGSDMSPALHALERDPEVEAALVITDGYIDYPEEPMPYEVLWVVTDRPGAFRPRYGQVLQFDEG
jgi:predicted metal-dependent peptidase